MLYLDFDGVLHHEDVWWKPQRGPCFGPKAPPTARLFEHVALLDAVLAPYPALRIVLSTSWAVRYSFRKARGKLPAALRRRVIGSTFHSAMDRQAFERASRGMQIVADVGRRMPGRWLALDDDAADWPAASRDRLVASDDALGLASAQVLGRLRDSLTKTFSDGGSDS